MSIYIIQILGLKVTFEFFLLKLIIIDNVLKLFLIINLFINNINIAMRRSQRGQLNNVIIVFIFIISISDITN